MYLTTVASGLKEACGVAIIHPSGNSPEIYVEGGEEKGDQTSY